jgi:hypothetical protein
MLIDIPVLIAFDCDPSRSNHIARAADQRVFTMRYDTTDTDVSAKWCLQYPPPANAHWIEDEQGVLFDLITSKADKAIAKNAEADPEAYAAEARI